MSLLVLEQNFQTISLLSMTRSDFEEFLYPHSLDRELRDRKGKDPIKFKFTPEVSAKKRAQYQAKEVFVWVYKKFITDPDQMTNLSKELREILKKSFHVTPFEVMVDQQAEDGTHKFLWKLPDQKTIESVVIPSALKEKEDLSWSKDVKKNYKGVHIDHGMNSEEWSRLTACVSSQVGCAMACKFCLTGVQGLDRHLKVEEIVGQLWELRKRAFITNIVFMGMGEPLHNLKNLKKALEILLDPHGLDFSRRKVTVSTSGIVPAIDELSQMENSVQLAISLNASSDDQREKIMPVNKKWKISDLLQAAKKYSDVTGRKITFEYVLLKDVNDSLEDARRVVKLLRGIPSKINLIPFNEHSGSDFYRPHPKQVRAFQEVLISNHYTATVRISRGQDILAACGQLRSLFGTARGTEKHKDYQTVEA